MLFRQTNIIWVAFVATQSLGPLLLHTIHNQMLKDKKNVKFSLTIYGQFIELIEGTFRLLFDPGALFTFIYRGLLITGGYVVVGVAFVAFVYKNRGVVVGDRNAHVAVFHPMQIMYFCAFTLALNASFHLTKIGMLCVLNGVLEYQPIKM